MGSGFVRKIFFVALMLMPLVSLIAQQGVIRAGVDLVVVPASVRDYYGHFIYDLMSEDFQIFEDGKLQKIRSFSLESRPLSVSVLVDTGVDRNALTNVADSLRSFHKAFTEVDEVEAYRFDHIVDRISGFTSGADLEKKLAFLNAMAERQPSWPTPIPILPGRGPKWLRELLDLNSQIPFKNLNDPLFMSAVDLNKRPPEQRKVVIIISDGQIPEDNTKKQVHTMKRTKDQLVLDQIQVYGVAMGNALLEGPTSILHMYANATGGDVYRGRDRYAIEENLSKITEQARREYVLGYVSNNEIRGLLPVNRKIEVKVLTPDLNVHHRKSYLQYPRSKSSGD